MTPATVQATFTQAGTPVVRYPKGAQLCDAHGCKGLDYLGDGIVYLAPRTKPQFEIIVVRTNADARTIAQLIHGRRRGNAVLFQLKPTAQIRAIFDRIRP
jgi:hypothetical protein